MLQRISDAVDLRDLHVYLGIILAAWGLEQVHPGAGWTVAGVALFYLGVFRLPSQGA